MVNEIRDAVMKEWGKLVAQNMETKRPLKVIVELTSAAYKEFNRDIMGMMNESFIFNPDNSIEIKTESIEFRLLHIPGLMLLEVVNNMSKRNTAKVGEKTICITSQ
jgi:hypothetical protein